MYKLYSNKEKHEKANCRVLLCVTRVQDGDGVGEAVNKG